MKKTPTADRPPAITGIMNSKSIGVASTCAENIKWLHKHCTLGWHHENLNGVVDISTFDSDHADTLPEVADDNGDCERS